MPYVIADTAKLYLAIAKSGMTISEVARIANIHRCTVHNILSGHTALPGTLGAVAFALDVELEEVIECFVPDQMTENGGRSYGKKKNSA